MRRAALLILLLLTAIPLSAQEEMPEVARTLMEEADHARQDGRVADAIAKYQRVLEVAPQLGSAYANLGALQFQQGKIDDAYATFTRGVERVPTDRTLLSNAAAAAQQLGKSAEALGYIDRAVERNPRDAALHSLRGTILRSLNRDDEALTALRQAVQLAPNESKYQFSLGNQLYALHKKDEAIAAYQRAVDLDKSNLRAYYNLGAVLFEAGRYSEALGAYRVALKPVEQSFAKGEKVDPIHARAYANLGAILLKQQQWAPAADAYRKALVLDPNSADLHYNLGFIAYNTNKPADAEQEYRKALAIDPELPLAYFHLANLALKRNDAAAAEKLLRDGLPRFDAETKPVAARMLARMYREQKRYDEAKTLLAEVPPDHGLLVERVLVARATNDVAAERTALEELLAREPNGAYRAALAVVLMRQNETDAARKQLDALASTPVAMQVRPLRALFLARDGNAAEALKELGGGKSVLGAVLEAMNGRRENAAKTLQEFATDPLARGDLGLVLWQLGKANDAKPHLLAAKTATPDWPDLSLALGEIALADRDYDAAETLLSSPCSAQTPDSLGTTDCARFKTSLALALLNDAARKPADRQSRQLVDRALALPLTDRMKAAALFLRGSYDLANGSTESARDSFATAMSLGLPAQAENAIRSYNAAIAENESASREVERVPEPTTSTPRRTVVICLPDAPAENEKKLAEGVSSLINQLAAASNVSLQTELFRRADDARAFITANRDRVGVVITNSELVPDDFTPKFQFSREGRTSYRRVVVVPAASPIKSAADLRGRTLSIAEGLRDTTGGGAKVMRTTDDLTAVANALYGKSDAALVSEANPLLADNAARLRVISTSGATPLPVVAFAAMPADDRSALTSALRERSLASMQLVALESEAPAKPAPRKIEIVSVPLGLTPPAPPASVSYRVSVKLPEIPIE